MSKTLYPFNFRKQQLALFVALLCSCSVFSQTVFWSDNFNNGCASNCVANTWNGWSILDNVDGTTGGAPNNWFVSCAEEGILPPGCGSSCIGDASLHIGANAGAGGDFGAGFNETGASNATFRLAVSPIINTSGKSVITLKFDFIAFGSAACSDDRAQLRLSTHNGATWPAGYQYCLTSACCGACNGYSQGQWTAYSLVLPAAFSNNPNVRVAFHWRNNGNGSGTDPSVAIDDIQLSAATVVPVKLVSFNGNRETSKVKLNWVSTAETNLKQYEVERSSDAEGFKKIGTVPAAGNNQNRSVGYAFNDGQLFPTSVFYRLKSVDVDGQFTYSQTIRVRSASGAKDEIAVLSSETKARRMNFSIWSPLATSGSFSVYSMTGEKILDLGTLNLVAGDNAIKYRVMSIPAGYYLLKLNVPKSDKPLSPAGFTYKFLYTM